MGSSSEDIRILLTTQAHFDHVGTHAHFKKLSGATVQAMAGDEKLLRDGGKSDYLFGDHRSSTSPAWRWTASLKDGDIVTIGGIRLTARHTPGHTPGSATYLMGIQRGRQRLQGRVRRQHLVNPGTRLVKDPSYPDDPRGLPQDVPVLESLKPDIFVSGHASFFNLRRSAPR